VAGLALTGCGAGNNAATSDMQPAISGVNVDAGDLALRDLQVDFGQRGVYQEGEAAPLRVWIDNRGSEPVVLEAVTSPAAEAVTLATEALITEEETPTADGESPTADATPGTGETETPGGETSAPGEDDAASPTADATESPAGEEPDTEGLLGEREFEIEIEPSSYVRLAPTHGSFLLLEGLKEELSSGSTVEVTFSFSNGEEVTVDLPMGEPAELASRSYFGDPHHEAAE
jgi:hypothetical protein